MALAARTVGMANTAAITSGHMPAGGRNIATASFAPIEEIAAKAAVLSDPNFSFQGYSTWLRDQDEDHQPPRNPTSNFDTNSTTFLHLLGQNQRDLDTGVAGNNSQHGHNYRITLARAVSAYETTADVISGAPKTKGTTISYSL